MAIHLVQYAPEIPQNTLNIMRTCVGTGIQLHLIKPLGFKLDEKNIIRSGVDYIKDVEYFVYENWEGFMMEKSSGNFYFCTQNGQKNHAQIDFSNIDQEYFIILGSESSGFSKEMLQPHLENCFRVPMNEHVESLNVSSVAAIVAYEALRQQRFFNL